jgi:hypothetical protein
MQLEEIKLLADIHGWEFKKWQEDIKMLSYIKDDMRINIYTTTMTIATCLDHPKQGKTQLFRKHVDPKLMEKIFKNPRIHSNKGYQKK